MLVHEFENRHHRLIYEDGKQGEWAAYEEVARLDEYGAVTHHHSHNLPLVFKVVEVPAGDYRSWHLELDSNGYWQKSPGEGA